MELTTMALPLLMGAVFGVVIGYFLRQSIARKNVENAETRVSKMFAEAKDKAAEIVLEAKNKAVTVLEDAKKEEAERNRQIVRSEERLAKKEDVLDRKTTEIEKQKDVLQDKSKQIIKIKEEVEGIKQEQLDKLQQVAELTPERAKEILINRVEKQHQQDILKRVRQLEADSAEEFNKKAHEIIVQAIQRYSGDHTAELTTTTINIPSDDMKGRIIGREGRNIRTLEQLTGVEVIIDDTPETIIISGFDPLRRQVAKLSLEKLIADGRIHPARIEEIVEETKKEINRSIKEAGEVAVAELGIVGFDPKLVQLIGRLKYRTSYGQNVLLHSVEVAKLAAGIAVEVGADPVIAKKAGLLHDIGKAVDHEIQGTHVEIGINILKKFNIAENIISAVKSHHEDYPFESDEAVIIKVADAISASRPGARKDSIENYIKRLEELEGIANSFDEVEKSYAIQAGREIRVFVTPDKIDDMGAFKLSRKIADQIEGSLSYPGEIKVHVIREVRSVEYAR